MLFTHELRRPQLFNRLLSRLSCDLSPIACRASLACFREVLVATALADLATLSNTRDRDIEDVHVVSGVSFT